jgi:hypothetical protein
VLLLAVVCAAGCQRKPRFVQQWGDSLAASAADTSAVLAESAVELWDRAQDRPSVSEASSTTARLVAQFLRARGGAALASGIGSYLDSLGIGAEVAADPQSRDLVVVNFFSRTYPEAGSLPYLFWRDGSLVRSQPIEGRGLRLFQLAARGEPPLEAALLFGRTVAGGYEPLLLRLRRTVAGNWELAQTVGTDSLGGVGRAEFARRDTSVVVRARTFRSPPRFDECETCPHIYRQRVLAWGPDGFHVVSERAEASPYQSFVEFVNLVADGDERGAAALAIGPNLVRDARQLGWDKPGPAWRIAPGAGESSDQMVFFRGPKEAYRVSFELHQGRWLVAQIEPTTRVIE